MRGEQYKTKQFLCFEHAEDAVRFNNQCAICLTGGRTKSWYKKMKQCKSCEKNICRKCRNKGLHNFTECKESIKRKKMEKLGLVSCENYESYYDAYEEGHYLYHSVDGFGSHGQMYGHSKV